MKIKKMEEAINEIMDKHSQYLFNKPYYQLLLSEQLKLDQYIKDLANPEWRPVIINGKDTGYKVSNIGQVTSIKKIGKFLRGNPNTDGYFIVKLYIGNKKKNISIHRLVAEAFIPNPENKPQVNHINGNKTCNWVGNLEWVTNKENVQHAYQMGLITPKIGQFNGATKYTDEEIHIICKLMHDGKTSKEISAMLNIPKHIPDNIRSKTSWIHISSNYNITNLKKKVSRPPNMREDIVKMLYNGMRDYEKMLNILNQENTADNRKYISGIKSELKRLKNLKV